MEFRVLGSLEVTRNGRAVGLGGPKQRLVLAHLLIRANRLVPADTLIEEIWGDEPPEAARSALQAYVSRLRKALGDGRIEGRPPGYVLHAGSDEVDVARFESLVQRAADHAGGDARRAADLLDEAIGLWKGRPLADLGDEPSLAPEVARLEQLLLAAREDRIDAALELGRPVDVSELERLTVEHPLRERLWGQLMLALYRTGRQAEALDAYRRAREVLTEELGIDPSPDLQRLHERILRQDPRLELQGEPLRGYRLLERIGEGTFSTVHRAFQPQMGREVAVKAIRPWMADDPQFVRRFEAEAQLVARLEHPRIVPIYDYWREPGGAYIVMRYLRGGSLRDRLASGPVNDATAVRIVDQVAEALHAAHRSGVIHRDVKPENILFDDDGNAYLADFGIAKDVFSAEGGGTRAGAMLGTPAYISPEQVRGEPVTPSTDVYSLGLVVFEAMTGRQPYPAEFEAAQLWKQLDEPMTSVLNARPDLPPEVDDVIARATAKVPGDRYPDPPAVAVALRQALGGGPRRAPSDVEARNPFKGLRPFLEADAADFFGREAVTEQLVQAMSEGGPRFRAVVGPSGSGKSSLVRAGLVPQVRRGALPGSERWFVVEMLPGAHPFEELEGALLRVAVNSPTSLMEQLERDEFGLLRAVKRVLPDDDSELLLVIDQFEELFTLVADEARRSAFIASLVAAVSDPRGRVRVVVTLRADFYDRPLQYRNFAQLLSTRTLVVSPPSIEELERAVTGPAEAVGVTVEPRVVAEILSDVADQPGALPLMQYALTELFAELRDSALTLEAYHRIGGVTGAIARRADALYDAQGPDGRAAARQLFLRLIALGDEGAEDTRRRVLLEELVSLEADRDAMAAVIDAYGERRLLSFDRDPVTRGPTVEVAHEALLRQWGRLRGWVEGAREDLRMHRRLDAAAAEWTKSGEDPSFLLSGSRLGQFEAWAAATDVALSDRERKYLESGLAQRDAERADEEVRRTREAALERRSVVRLRAMIAILTIAALIASALSIVAIGQRSTARRVARVATAHELASAAVANLDVDPERSILLALQAVATTRQDGTVVPEAVEALHGAVAADRQVLTLRDPSTANVAWSPDGRLIGTGGSVGGNHEDDVILWDARTGGKVLTLKGHTADIGYLAFSPDSSRLVTTGDDDRAIVWDTTTGARLLTIPNVQNGAGTFSPDGRRIVLGSTDGSIKVVDATTGRPSLKLKAGSNLCQSPVFSPDGSLIAAPADGGPIWDARTGALLHSLPEPDGSCNVAFSPDGRELASTNGNEVTVWSTRTWTMVERLQGHTGSVIGLDWSPDGTRIATGANDGTARIWDAATGQQILELAGHSGLVANVAFSPDGTRLVTGGGDGTARVWDVSPAATAEWLGDAEPGPMFGVAYAPDGRSLLTTGFGPGQGAWRWDAATGRRIGGYRDVYEVEFAADGSILLVGDRVEIARPGSRVSSLNDVPNGGFGLGYARDGSLIAESSGRRQSIVVWTSDGRRVRSFGPAGPDDTFIQSAFSPDGSLVAGLTGRAALDVWDVATGKAVFHRQASTGQARSIAFSPDGSRLVTSGADGASIWAMPSGRRIARLSGVGAIGAVAFTPDGKRVATGGDDGTARIWDAATGEELLTLTGHTDSLTGVAFSPDGTRLATTGLDGMLRVYVLPVDQLERLAESRLTRGFTKAECKQYLHVATCPSGPTPAPTPSNGVPAPYGPEGAYRVTIARSDLQHPGINRSEIPNSVGTFTLSLAHGTWRLHLDRADGQSDDQVGRYTISGRRITLAILDDTCSFGGNWSATWSADATELTLTNIASNVPAACDPVDFQAVTSAVFGSHPLTRVL